MSSAIGAMTRHRELLESPLLVRRAGIFADAERVIADPVVRNRGTIGGALCQADPSEDLSAVCAAVDAQMVIRSLAGTRTVDVHDFYLGPYRTAVADDEMLVEIRIPVRRALGQRIREGASPRRRLGGRRRGRRADAVRRCDLRRAGRARRGRRRNHLSRRQEGAARRRRLTTELFERAGAAAAAACAPITDQRGSAEYKRHVVGVLATRALRSAAARAAEAVA